MLGQDIAAVENDNFMSLVLLRRPFFGWEHTVACLRSIDHFEAFRCDRGGGAGKNAATFRPFLGVVLSVRFGSLFKRFPVHAINHSLSFHLFFRHDFFFDFF